MYTEKGNRQHGNVRTCLLLTAAAGMGLAIVPAQAAPHSSHGRPAHKTTVTRRVSTPKDSYLEYKVYTVDQLIEQVQNNASVRQRFARHFQIPESRVISFMRSNLVESYVPQTQRYTVYCARPSGKFYRVRQTFHRGTKVFALKNGEPVMKWLCGNPLSHFLPDVQVKYSYEHPPTQLVSREIQELTPTESVNVLVPSEVPVIALQPSVPVTLVSPSTAILSRGGTSLLPFLLPVALLGINTGGGHTPTPAVPEPSSLAYLAAGVPLGLLMVRRRFKSK